MFAGVEEVSYVESAILKIQNAKSQDDINDVMQIQHLTNYRAQIVAFDQETTT